MNQKKRDLSKYFLPDLKQARKRVSSATIVKNSFNIPNNLVNYGKNKTYHIKTYGCQANVRDSETMMGLLELVGYEYNPDYKTADLVLLNTCAIREHAEQKVFSEIGLLQKIKQTNPNFIFGMCGCMAQEESVVNKILQNNYNIDFIFGTHNIHRILNILEQTIFEKNLVIEVWSKEGDVYENLPAKRLDNLKAYVNIMYGCDQFCTYCIVPVTRGKIRSRSKTDILNEVIQLQKQGYQEVTLIGQNVNSYGIDNHSKKPYLFANLLADVAKTTIPRVRFSTSNPWNFNKNIVDVMKAYKNIMPHVHLPIQSGDEKILKMMNRGMRISTYLELINYIKTNLNPVAITTDLIVGFPNETDLQFENTLKLYQQVEFDNAFTFIFSPRIGTPAALMDDKTSLKTKKDRLNKLNELVKYYAKLKNQNYVNSTLKVLVDGVSKNNKDVFSGYSPQWKIVNFTGKNIKPGEIIDVLINSASRFTLNGIKVG